VSSTARGQLLTVAGLSGFSNAGTLRIVGLPSIDIMSELQRHQPSQWSIDALAARKKAALLQPSGSFLRYSRRQLHRFALWRCVRVRREGNSAADRLANRALDLASDEPMVAVSKRRLPRSQATASAAYQPPARSVVHGHENGLLLFGRPWGIVGYI
jgi:hypothetical protein